MCAREGAKMATTITNLTEPQLVMLGMASWVGGASRDALLSARSYLALRVPAESEEVRGSQLAELEALGLITTGYLEPVWVATPEGRRVLLLMCAPSGRTWVSLTSRVKRLVDTAASGWMAGRCNAYGVDEFLRLYGPRSSYNIPPARLLIAQADPRLLREWLGIAERRGVLTKDVGYAIAALVVMAHYHYDPSGGPSHVSFVEYAERRLHVTDV